MPQQAIPQVENAFTKGLLTEFTGLNFPQDAATDCDNCLFTLVGNVTRREGIDKEVNGIFNAIDRTNAAVATYKWNNAGGDGETQVVVQHVGIYLFFFVSSSATVTQPLTGQLLTSYVTVSNFVASGATFDPTVECQFSDGNGYLFVYHPDCDPFYCTYDAGTVTGNSIQLQIRDFVGIPELTLQGANVGVRPNTLSAEHQYNLANQGWNTAAPWSATSTTPGGIAGSGNVTYTVAAGISGITNGQQIRIYVDGNLGGANLLTQIYNGSLAMGGTVIGYSGTSLTINLTSYQPTVPGGTYNGWSFVPFNIGYVSTWQSDIGNYPSNADVWWYFKDDTDVFNPTTTVNNVTLATGNAPQGHFLLNPFVQAKNAYSPGVTNIVTTARPRTGCWFQGRVWYTGIDAQQPATGDAGYYTWTENLYFSQIVQSPLDFGSCFQTNDPTSEDLFDLLPTDGGVITIQGSGSIYKLFPIQNGMLVFAANGVWFITGSTGIGFSANDYTITKISSVRSISPYSFVNVNGLPMFWNEEGIYSVEPQQGGGGLAVSPITIGTIQTFYDNIPYSSKKYARADYDPIGYVIQWIYKSTEETSVTDRYTYDSILNLNTYNKAFYPYNIGTDLGSINGIIYVSSPGGTNAPDATIKYACSQGTQMSFADEHDTSFTDWSSLGGENYISYFVTGYRLNGQAQRRIQIPYIYTFSRGGLTNTSFYLQAIWDYATSGNTGRWSTQQQVNNFDPNYAFIPRRHRLRGQGLALQIKVTSVDGQLFDLMGWSTFTSANTGV